MKLLIRLLWVVGAVAYAQTPVEKSLLWEISGNGLAKKSYLYGTFHVNDKISYHLPDDFYTHLLNADIVSNESNPETWNTIFELLYSSMGKTMLVDKNPFTFKPIAQQQLVQLFNSRNFLKDMSSVNNGPKSDFEENAVLDMFIFQTAKKHGKKVVGLEDAKASIIQLIQATRAEMEKQLKDNEEDPATVELRRSALTKILKGRSEAIALKDYYREKDIVMLDSLSKLTASPGNHKALIIDRNYTMTRSIDSLARQGSLFSAVGAAHLAGKEGILQLLRNKGFTVTPVLSTTTQVGRDRKKSLENLVVPPLVKTVKTSDGLLQHPEFEMTIEVENMVNSLDLANGAYLNINRIPLNNFLQKRKNYLHPQAIDSLMYEFIPGEIQMKKQSTEGPYTRYDMVSKLKNGNVQRYRIYLTPLEAISMALSGVGDYAQKMEARIFNALQIAPLQTGWKTKAPVHGGFQVQLPAYCATYNDSERAKGQLQWQAYDPTDQSYYLVLEKQLSDNFSPTDGWFLHSRLHNEFYMHQELPETAQFTDYTQTAFESFSQNDHHNYRLKSVVHGGKCYLLVAVDAPETQARKFFNSFAITPFTPEKTTVYHSKKGKYSVEIPERANDATIHGVDFANTLFNSLGGDDSDDEYLGDTFTSRNGHFLEVTETRFERFETWLPADSLKTQLLNRFTAKFTPRTYDNELQTTEWSNYVPTTEPQDVVLHDFTYNPTTQTAVFDALVAAPQALHAQKIRVITTPERQVTLTSMVPYPYTQNIAFVEKAFGSFTLDPSDKPLPPNDRLQLFFDEVKSETDSIRNQALDDMDGLTLTESEAPRWIQWMQSYPFSNDEEIYKDQAYELLRGLKAPEVVPFLEQAYRNPKAYASERMTILDVMSENATPEVYEKIGALLAFDLPLPDNTERIEDLFNTFKKHPDASAVLYPDLFKYCTIDEYKAPLVDWCAHLLNRKKIDPKKLGSFQKMLLADAKLEQKRLQSSLEEQTKKKKAITSEDDDEVYVEDEIQTPYGAFYPYVSLLKSLPNKKTEALVQQAYAMDIPEMQLQLLADDILQGRATAVQIDSALARPELRFKTLVMLSRIDTFNKRQTLTDDQIAEAAMRVFDEVKDDEPVQFLEKQTLNYKEHTLQFYFYESQPQKDGKPYGAKVFHAMAFLVRDGKIVPHVYFSPVVEDIDEENTAEKLKTIIIQESLYRQYDYAKFRKINPLLPDLSNFEE
ncbi:TraB/GumN family protein [Flavobacterium sp.]|uniref:TraB/GumN family protein n=2 Tax=Flavobacterium sp. TaxID=239 RepID=UPI0022CB2D8B|nr:TraB/GumN family protein [Flavobacterium sp.]MCZ8144385.1 TraB/GumN family protein [Flavobacterium sp.]MCZ8367959.1 TraB/GumN family protein [Flavobacterium sp.]